MRSLCSTQVMKALNFCSDIMKRHLTIPRLKVLVLMMAMPLLAAAQISDNTYMFLRGEGTAEKPYIIDSYEALVEYRELVALTPFEDRGHNVCFKANIDLGADPNWAPIRYYDAQKQCYFKGGVDGQGHIVSNMTIDKHVDGLSEDDVYLGLFARTNGNYTTISNVNLENVKINVTLESEPEFKVDVHAGALAGFLGSMAKNIDVNGEITVFDENDETESSRNVNLGGIAGTISDDGNMGVNSWGEETPCNLNADIDISSEALGSNIGGIVGYAENVDFRDCTSSGMLTGRIVEPELPNMASLWNISIGGICGYSNNNDYSFYYDGLCSVCRVEGGNWTGGLFGNMHATFSRMNSYINLKNCHAAGGVSNAYNRSGGLIGIVGNYTNSHVTTTLELSNCYYAGTLTLLGSKTGKALIGNYNGDGSQMSYSFSNCFYDKRMMTDNTDYQTLLGVGTSQQMTAYIYGYETSQITGESSPFSYLADEEDWVFAEKRYPQLKSIKDTPVSTLAVTPIFFKGNENAERVYLGATLTETSFGGEKAVWSAPMGNGSVVGLKLMSDAVGYEILTLTAGTCSKRLNLYMANSDEKWEGEAHIPVGTKEEVMAGGKGVATNPYIIMNAGQLAYAVKNNNENEYYQLGHDIIINRNLLGNTETAIPWIDTKKAAYAWKANLDGNGCLVHGMYLPKQSDRDNSHKHGLLGSIVATGRVANMGMVETVITDDFTAISGEESYVGSIAGTVESGASLENCFTSGYIMLKAQQGLLYAGGICGKASGTISDCINATSVMGTERDVMASQMGGIAGKAGNAQFNNCLNIGRVSFFGELADKWQGGVCPGDGYETTDCYHDLMMTACDADTTGKPTSQLTDGTLFSGKSRWSAEAGSYPILKDFADTDYMKLISRPLAFNEDDCSAEMKNILELPLGKIQWSKPETEACLRLYADYGLAEPKGNGTARLTATMNSSNGRDKSRNTVFITVPDDFTEGIQFVDPEARKACVEAFGSNGILTLEQAMSISDFSPFVNHPSSSDIVKFPEMRYFTGVNRLTTQLSTCYSLEEVELPLGLKSIAADAFDGCNSLDTVSLPVNLAKVEPYAFRNSSVKQILVNTGNNHFTSREGVLFDENEYIVAYPPRREGASYMYTAPIKGILTGAFQGIEQLETLYIGDDEGQYIDLRKNAIPVCMQVFVNDATDNSTYIDEYRYEESRDWQYIDEEGNLARYYPLKVTSAKYATMCIYFDTQLPVGMKAYYCYERDDAGQGMVRFHELEGRKVPAGVPVLIYSTKAGCFPLFEYDGGDWLSEPDDQCDYFLGSGEHGFIVGDQSSSSGTQQGSILTLGHNKDGVMGFFFYRNDTNKIPAYRAYLMVETLSAANGYGISFDEANDIATPMADGQLAASSSIYDLSGRKVAEGAEWRNLPKGIYIQNGRKICIK